MKNRNIPYYVATLMLAAGVSTSFVSCVDTDEPSSIEELRKAKANEVNAQAAYKNALAQTQLQTAEIQKAKAAQEAIQTQIKELERQATESNLTVTKAKNELEVLKAENGKVHEKAIAAIVEVKDARWLTAQKACAIDTALIYDARVAEKEAELKQLKDKAEADLASAAAKLQKQINDTKRFLISLDMENTMRNAEQSDSVLIYAAENDEIAANLLTAKQNADGLVTKTFDAWIQAKLEVLKAQSKLTEAQYDLDVVSNADGKDKDGNTVEGEISFQYAEKGVENAKLATAAAQKNLTDLQALKENKDYQSWITAYENAQKYIDVDLANRTIERQKTLAEKKKAKITADAAEKTAENAYNDFAKTQIADRKTYNETPNFYEYDLKDAANTYANLIDYIANGNDATSDWKKKLGDAAYDIKKGNADDVKKNFAFNNTVGGVFFVSQGKESETSEKLVEKPILNEDYANKIAVLYKDGKDGDGSVFGQFIANTKSDTEAKEKAEKALAEISKTVMGSDGKGKESTDTKALVKIWNAAITTYDNAVTKFKEAQDAYEAIKKDNSATTEQINAKKTLYDDAAKLLVTSHDDLSDKCKQLFGTEYATTELAKANTNAPDKAFTYTKEGSEITESRVFKESKFIYALPTAKEQKTTDDAYTKFGNYSTYLKAAELTVPEWTRKVKADADAAKFVKEVKAKSTGQSITETLEAIAKKQDELNVAVITALNSDDAKKALADWQTKKAAKTAAEDAVEMYEEYYKKGTDGKYTKEVAHAKAVVDKAIQDETEAQKTLVDLYKTLIETLYNKTYTPSGEGAKALTYDPKTYDELYAKAEIALKKAVEEAKDAQATAEAKLEAAQKGEKYTTGSVSFDIFSVTASEKTTAATPAATPAASTIAKPNVNIQKLNYTVSKNTKTISTTTKADYIAALNAAVKETQSNVDDLNTQYEAAKKLYEEAMTKVAEYMKAN